MIDEDMINNILDDADPNFYFFEEDKFVKITDSVVCSEDLFDDFSFEYDLDLDEDKPLFLASNFIKYDEYYAPLFFIPILYYDGVIKSNSGSGNTISGTVKSVPSGYKVTRTLSGNTETAILKK